MRTIIMALAFTTASAQAAEFKQVFTVNGTETSAQEAIIAAANGKEVMKCQTVEFKVSKSGTSIGLKNVKKPKASESSSQ